MSERAFYYDIVCPYAYMAFSLLHRQEIFSKHKIALNPILLGGLFKLMEKEVDPNASMPIVRSSYLRRDIIRQAQFFDIPLSFHPRHPISTLKAMRMLVMCPPNIREALSERFYRAYWQENLNIDDEQCLIHLAREISYEPSLESEEVKEKLKEKTKEAFLNNIFGVPTIFINNRLYFGSDRLYLIKDDLLLSLKEEEWAPSSKTLDFYFDFSSPYSYLAHAEIKKAVAANVSVRFIPVLLGAIFKALGVNNIPMLSVHPNKTRYFMQDMVDWAEARHVPFIFSSNFPLRSVNALRVAILEPAASAPIFEAAWAKDQDIGDDAVLASVLENAGLSTSLLSKTQDQDFKDKLKNNTDEALKRGIFGVPSFFLDNELVFGQDRFPWLKAHLK